MPSVRFLHRFGLLLGLFGTVILFFFGFPQPDFSDSSGFALPGEIADARSALKAHYTGMAAVGLSALVLSFASQALGSFCGRE